MKTILSSIVSLILGIALAAPLQADGDGGGSAGSRLAPFQQLIDDGDYQRAIDELDQALAENPEDADLLNLIAYSHRQLERYEIALNYYQQALELEPDHRGANEYLGELYLHLGELEKAEQRLEVLDKECFFGCREFDQLEQAIQDYRKQNSS